MGFGHALDAKQQTLNINPKGNDFKITADRDKIEQVFVNLIDNAVKYTENAGRINISLLEQQDAITVMVEDNGIGIAKEHLNIVFERFYRLDKARSRELGGTGLGLGIAKHIVLAPNAKARDFRSFGDMLFDRKRDPNETTNLIDKPNYAKVQNQLKEHFNDFTSRVLATGKMELINVTRNK